MAKNGYWVVCYKSVSNPATVSEYSKLAATALKALGGRVIAGGKPAQTHEDGADQSVVIVEFEGLEKAIAAYDRSVRRRRAKGLSYRRRPMTVEKAVQPTSVFCIANDERVEDVRYGLSYFLSERCRLGLIGRMTDKD